MFPAPCSSSTDSSSSTAEPSEPFPSDQSNSFEGQARQIVGEGGGEVEDMQSELPSGIAIKEKRRKKLCEGGKILKRGDTNPIMVGFLRAEGWDPQNIIAIFRIAV